MATLSLHYITLRSKQIGLKLKKKKKSWLYLDVVWFFIIRAMFSTKFGFWNELCLNEVDAQKVSDSFCFCIFFSLCLKAGWDVLLLYSRIPLNPVHRPARCIRLNCVSIDPSELYHITQSCYPPHSFRPLWRLCMWLLSVIHWFPLASWFSPFLPSSFHALMHWCTVCSHSSDTSHDLVWNIFMASQAQIQSLHTKAKTTVITGLFWNVEQRYVRLGVETQCLRKIYQVFFLPLLENVQFRERLMTGNKGPLLNLNRTLVMWCTDMVDVLNTSEPSIKNCKKK